MRLLLVVYVITLHVFLPSVEVLYVSCILEIWTCHGGLVIVLCIVIAHLIVSTTVATILVNLSYTSMIIHHGRIKMMIVTCWDSTNRSMTSTLPIDKSNS